MRQSGVLLSLAATALHFADALPSHQLPRNPVDGLTSLKRRYETSNSTNGNDATGYNGAAACEVGLCSEIGVDTLRKGGNAADGMIAMALCVGTIAAYHSGIGGGGFMLVRHVNEDGSHGYSEIDFRETMPDAGNETMYSSLGANQTASTIGGLAVGVPGEMHGWQMLHQKYGKLPWSELFEPAINLGRNGFPVTIDLAAAIAEENVTISDPLFAEIYAPNGTKLVEGDIAYRPRYADTLQKIANSSADAFYSGEIAQSIVDTVQNTGGIMTIADLANYTAIEREPVNITYRNTRIFSTVAPSSGAVVLSALKIYEGYPGSSSLPGQPGFNESTHYLIEADKCGYAFRTTFGDPAFTSNVTMLERESITYETALEARAKISPNQTFGPAYYDPIKLTATRESGTSHMAIVDKDGMSISLTTTVNLYFGAQIMTETGIILNNEMDDFSSPGQTNSFGFAPAPVNFIRPGKRPQSSIASSIAEDLETGEFIMATGSAGGSRIITATLQELYHHIDQGLNASQCVHSSRWHDQLSGMTYFELPAPELGISGFDNGTVAYLEEQGYNITYQGEAGSTSHVIIRFPNGMYEAASDPRKAAGYGAAF